MPLDFLRDKFPMEQPPDLGGKTARQYMDGYDTRQISETSPYDVKDIGQVASGLSDAYLSSIMELPMMAMRYLMPEDTYEKGVLQSGPQDRMREQDFAWQRHMEDRSQDAGYATGQDYGAGLGVIADPFIDAPLMGVPALGKALKLMPDATAKMGSGIMGRLMDETGALVGQRGMEKLGVDPASDLVGQYSGLWDKGIRAELDDAGSATHPLILKGDVSDWSMGSMGIDVKETMSHPSLYQAYEDLGSLPTQGNIQGGIDDLIGALSGEKRSNVQGSYSPRGITLNTSPKGLQPVMAHELTHGVQDAEDFARGGSPSTMRPIIEDMDAQAFRSADNEYHGFRETLPDVFQANREMDWLSDELFEKYGINKFDDAYDIRQGAYMDLAMSITPEDKAARQLLQNKYNKAVEALPDSWENKEFRNFLDTANKRFETMSSGRSKTTPEDAYTRLAGEWEARNAGTRSTLSQDDKRLGEVVEKLGVKFRAGQPFSTADNFALEDLIVRMK